MSRAKRFYEGKISTKWDKYVSSEAIIENKKESKNMKKSFLSKTIYLLNKENIDFPVRPIIFQYY
ncbi:MAG TPA: hypothetical protein QF753_12950 [Victivallales bacterium]|nr:hypothetical protein [Victivallales bacterium]